MKKEMYPRNVEITDEMLATMDKLNEGITAQGTAGAPSIMKGKYFGHKLLIGKDAEGNPALQNSAPTCCLIAVKTSDDTVRVGWAKRHAINEDGKPTKREIMNTALLRALADTVQIETDNFALMGSGACLPRAVAREMGPFVDRAIRYFKGCKIANVA